MRRATRSVGVALGSGLGRCCASRTPEDHAAVERVLRLVTRSHIDSRAKALDDELAKLRRQRDDTDARVAVADAKAVQLTKAAALGTLGFLAAQFAVLFNWVFFVFDWNLVEPVTYFLAYTCVWAGVVFYGHTGTEWSYDSTREVLEAWRRDTVLASLKVDPAARQALLDEIATLEAERKRLSLD